MKSGFASSEFIFAAIMALVGALISSGIFLDGSVWLKLLGVVQMTLVSLGYSVSRGLAKGGAAATTTSIGGSVLGDSAAKLAIAQSKDEVKS